MASVETQFSYQLLVKEATIARAMKAKLKVKSYLVIKLGRDYADTEVISLPT